MLEVRVANGAVKQKAGSACGLYLDRAVGKVRRSAEIEMVMVAAGRVERSGAMRAARVASEIGGNGECAATGAAEDGGFVPLGLRPRLEGMSGECVVAVFTSVEKAAAAHFDGDDVGGRMVVQATRLRVEAQAVDFGTCGHRETRTSLTQRHGNGAAAEPRGLRCTNSSAGVSPGRKRTVA